MSTNANLLPVAAGDAVTTKWTTGSSIVKRVNKLNLEIWTEIGYASIARRDVLTVVSA